SDYAVTAAPTITSTGDDVSAETEVTVTVDAPEWHNLYYTINGEDPTESSDIVENGQITFTATEGEYVVKVVAQEGIRLVSPVSEVTYRVVDTHGITVSATEGGTADFSINEGEGTVTLTATEPTEGYYFVGWSVGESVDIVSEDLTYTTTIVENASYKANYAKRTYTVTVTTNNAEWGTVNSIANPVTHGETVTLTATPAEGYRFVNWTKGGNQVSTDPEYTTEAITANVEYIANFEEIPQIQYYSVVAIAGTGGSATASSNSVEENTTVTLTATPDSGYTFRNWTVDGKEVSTDNPYIPTITANTKYVAHFVPENANTLPTGYCTISSLAPNWGHATSHSLVSFGVNVGGAVQLASENVPSSAFNDLTGSKSVTAKQGDQLEITFVNGTYSNNVWAGFDWDRDGDWDVVVAAYSEPGRTGGSNDEGSITITIPDDAKLGKSRLRILSDGDVSGDANVPFDKSSPMCGTYGSGKIGYAGSYYDITLYVEEGYVSDVTYNVTVSSADENMGTASASASVVLEKRSVTLTAEPKEGYRFVNWTNEGNEVSTDNPYTIQSVTDNINYVANFEKLPTYTVTVRSNNDAMGVVTPSSSQVIYGNTATIKAVAKPNYRFVNWTKGTDVVSTNATFTTPIITADAEYIANFEAMPTEAEKISIVDASTNFATYQSNVISNIKDGNYSTLFWSEGAQEIGKYVMVDLGALYNVEDIKFYFDSGDKPYGAVVEISTDNSTWTEVSTFVTTDLGADNTYVCDAEKKTAQYIRMRINVAGSNWLKLKEFEVYGLKIATSSADITRTTALEGATVKVTTDAPATIKVGTETYTTTAENLTATITLNATSAETVTIESIGATITEIECDDNATPTEIPLSVTELTLRNVNAGEVEIDAPLLEKITVVSDADDNVATVAPTSDLSQGVQVVVEKEINTPQTLGDGSTPTIFNFLSMPFAFNTADIKYWDGDSWETAVPENHVRILLYDSQKRANNDYKNTWEKITTSTHKSVAANQGFVIVGNNDLGTTVKLQFTSAAAAYDGTVTSVTANRYRKAEGET
ncbi:MAG: discoidin domain-containing protein, partial [Bacteroidaceae bacterium]|nr:discoidin domain-containing protein [Bacteroidaceae bacterium]